MRLQFSQEPMAFRLEPRQRAVVWFSEGKGFEVFLQNILHGDGPSGIPGIMSHTSFS
jgi:hypothetical protein